jgi:hypothetical protein
MAISARIAPESAGKDLVEIRILEGMTPSVWQATRNLPKFPSHHGQHGDGPERWRGSKKGVNYFLLGQEISQGKSGKWGVNSEAIFRNALSVLERYLSSW